MDTSKAQELMQKYLKGNCSPEEHALMESWYNKAIQERKEPLEEPDYELLHRRLAQSLPAGSILVKQTRLWPKMLAAVAAVVVIVGTVWLFYNGKIGARQQNELSEIRPGRNTATLTVDNGKVITLSEAKEGVVIGSDKLTYNDGTDLDHNASVVKNKIITATTPRGGTYYIVLPDGTKVWLNAASYLKFPSTFANLDQRKVELIGEAYFEVTKNKLQPFVVVSRNQEVKVLGTHFNINSYPDERSIRTTLLEGTVEVTASGVHPAVATLMPGQQTQLNPEGLKIAVVNLADEVDWKNGDFVFKDQGLQNIMRKIARWYDVEVVYQDDVPQEIELEGLVSRSKSISQVLSLISFRGKVHFKIEGRKVIVSK